MKKPLCEAKQVQSQANKSKVRQQPKNPKNLIFEMFFSKRWSPTLLFYYHAKPPQITSLSFCHDSPVLTTTRGWPPTWVPRSRIAMLAMSFERYIKVCWATQAKDILTTTRRAILYLVIIFLLLISWVLLLLDFSNQLFFAFRFSEQSVRLCGYKLKQLSRYIQNTKRTFRDTKMNFQVNT